MNTKKFSIKFYPRLDKINKQGLAPIYVRIMSDKKVELSTTMSVIPKNWDIKAQRVNKKANNAQVVNPFLDSFNAKILDAYSKLFIEEKQINADNEPVISHTEFIETMAYEVKKLYHAETILKPSIRLSHPIKGRIPEAKNKAASELLEHERTIYYERMAFIIEIPSVYDEIEGSRISLCVGGVKAYNIDNLYNKKGSDEHFKIFIGFKNKVCTNLCIWTDGLQSNLKVQSSNQLRACIQTLIENFNPVHQLRQSATLVDYSLTEQQFAQIIGRCRMYQCLSNEQKKSIPFFPLGDAQLSSVCKGYYNDENFKRNEDGSISVWRLYNLLTGANKSSYIDNFMERNANLYDFTEGIKITLQNKSANWFLT